MVTATHLAELLERSAADYPDRIAVVDREQHLTYAQLNALANQIAHQLIAWGIGAEMRVGIYLPKSLHMVAAVYGVLKTGAAYVPIAPGAPPARAAWLVEDCGLHTLITADGLLTIPDMKPMPSLRDMITDSASRVVRWADIAHQPTTNLQRQIAPDDLAYILYTSGSTGNPKGVMIEQRAALNFVAWACGELDLQPEDRLANHAPLQFDLSVFDLFASAMAGAALHLVDASMSMFPLKMVEYVQQNALTVWYSVPTALVHLVTHGQLEKTALPSLRHIVFAGEVFPLPPLQRLMRAVPNAAYHNWYGPTETNVCTAYRVSAIPDEPLPIGQACAGYTLSLINEDDTCAANTGELVAAGASLMRGYWNDPERTAASLIALPEGQRAYRTRDRVQKLPDSGGYAFLGRIDHMIKSKGYRIEPAEIEHVLHQHPAVSEAVVVPIPDANWGNLLKAIIVAAPTPELHKALKAWCAERLPAYMIPTYFSIQSDALPRTVTGKIDRTRLT